MYSICIYYSMYYIYTYICIEAILSLANLSTLDDSFVLSDSKCTSSKDGSFPGWNPAGLHT